MAAPSPPALLRAAMCILQERTNRASPQVDVHQCVPARVSSRNDCDVVDRHPTRHVLDGGKWRTELQIATWNGRVWKEQEIDEILDMMDNRDLNVICMTETK